MEYKTDCMEVYLDGEIDHHNAAIIRSGIDDALILRKPQLLVLDFGGVTFMDSSGVGLVMGRYRLVSAFGGKIELKGLSPSAYKMFCLSGLEALVKIHRACC